MRNANSSCLLGRAVLGLECLIVALLELGHEGLFEQQLVEAAVGSHQFQHARVALEEVEWIKSHPFLPFKSNSIISHSGGSNRRRLNKNECIYTVSMDEQKTLFLPTIIQVSIIYN
jgi:hypothetical protein